MKKTRMILAVILAMCFVIGMLPATVAAAPSEAETNATYYNNATITAADPFVLYDENSGYYYAYSTDGASRGYNYGVYRSPDLVTWEKASDGALSTSGSNRWGSTWYWAPEVYHNEDTGLYFLFFSAMMKPELREDAFKYANFEEACKIGVAVSDKPEGPFNIIDDMPIDYFPYDPDYYDVNLIMDSAQMKPPATQEEGMTAPMGTYIPTIDANVFFDDDGRIYLYYSRNAYRNWVWDDDLGKYIEESNIYAVELNTDWWSDPTGTTMPTIKEEYINATKSEDDPENVRKDGFIPIINYGSEKQSWENAHVNDYTTYNGGKKDRRWAEGSTTLKYYFDKDGDGVDEAIYYILYSCNNYENENYGIGYAVADNPLGPWDKAETNPILSQDPEMGIYSTGHGSFITTPAGESYYVYHGRSSTTGGRRIYSDRIYIDESILDENGVPVIWIDKSTTDRPVPTGTAPYSIEADDVLIDLNSGNSLQTKVDVKTAAGASLPLANVLNRVTARIVDEDVAEASINAGTVTVTGKISGKTVLKLTYQRLSDSGEYYDVTNGNEVVSIEVPVEVVEGTITAGTVTASCGDAAAVDLIYAGEEAITSARIKISSELPIESIETEHVIENNNGYIVIYSLDGSELGSVICTLNYDLDVNPWYANGNYPIEVDVVDATGDDMEEIVVGGIDGAVILDNNYETGDVDLDGIVSNADVIALARYLVDLIEFDAVQLVIADYDADDEIDNSDLVKLVRSIVEA